MTLLVVTPSMRYTHHLLNAEEAGHEHEDGRRVRGQALCGVTGARGSRYGTVEGWLYFQPGEHGQRRTVSTLEDIPVDACAQCQRLARRELS